MSSPKAARTVRRAAVPAHPAAKRVPAQPAAKPASKIANGAAGSAEAKRLAAELERALASGRRDVLSTDALQVPLPERGGATATDVMITASGLLKAANLAVFELGMWQSWTGR